MLELRGVSKQFGGLRAISDLSFSVDAGEFVGIMGPNGAGKTTLLNLLTGYLAPSAGEIRFNGRAINGLRPFHICRLGIGRTFQVVKPFSEMSVEDNVIAGTLFSFDGRLSVAGGRERAREPLELTGLWPNRSQMAGSLTIGGKKKLELARALAVKPRLLLLDEVMGGLTRFEVVEIGQVLRRIHATGVTVVMVEHVVEAILRLTGRVIVLNFGEKLFEGEPEEVIAHPAVVESYLGRPLESSQLQL
jgi:branched-chain amino acid transport system ATP-binding protein